MKRFVLPAVLMTAATAHAQQTTTITDVEVPMVVLEQSDTTTGETNDDLDLANVVQSAAKGRTTVQEAPAIVTVITADEIRDRQLRSIQQVYETVPGWYSLGLFSSSYELPAVRGQLQAVQYLHDGVSLFDPNINIPSATRVMPMELVKRVEAITGPGGVLWGSNSLVGILNVITKDAEDVEGVEVGGELGDGNGDRLVARAYVMAGRSDLLGGKLKAFAHASIESYGGPELTLPMQVLSTPTPQPNSTVTVGPLTSSEQGTSLVASFFTKVTLGKLQLRVQAPFADQKMAVGFGANPIVATRPDDVVCPPSDTPTPGCSDPLRLAREQRADVFDRYVVAEYRTRFANEKAGLTTKFYAQQFVRNFKPMQIFAPTADLAPGGLSFSVDMTSYRAGGAVEGDYELTRALRVQYGVEAFHEWKPDNVERSRQGAGSETIINTPYDLARLPILCPRAFNPATMQVELLENCPLTFSFLADRSVLGAYVNPQFRPTKKLILDAGARIQAAPPQLGSVDYDVDATLAAALVWNFIPNWHLKLNYTQGFRPPVFNNVAGNGTGLQFQGNKDLNVEKSDAAQAEVNARIWKGDRRIRELSFRLDGSYTRLSNLIQVATGSYANSGDRAIASGELLAKLYVQGGHRLELGYTYLRIDTNDRGRMRSTPENWFDVATVFSILPEKLTATTRLRVTGAYEDPNRIFEYRGLVYDPMTGAPGTTTGDPTDMVLDRIPSHADLMLGMAYTPTKKLSIRAAAYNVLGAHNYYSDAFFDYEPRTERDLNPMAGFRAYVSALFQY